MSKSGREGEPDSQLLPLPSQKRPVDSSRELEPEMIGTLRCCLEREVCRQENVHIIRGSRQIP